MTTQGSSPTIHASCPGAITPTSPGAVVHLLAIVHHDLHPAGNEVPQVWRLATLGARNRLHMLRPLPARLERRTTNRSPFEVDQLKLALTVLKWPSFIRGVETLADQTGHSRLLTSSRDVHVAREALREGSEDGPFGWSCPWNLRARTGTGSGHLGAHRARQTA